MKEYVTIKAENLSLVKERFSILKENVPQLQGAEIYCSEITDREKNLYNSEKELDEMALLLKNSGVRRLHCSYWASPSDFLYREDKSELLSHFGSEEAVREYYTDLTGEHLFDRWCQEYALAGKIKAEAYVFHLIDYFPIDGQWVFSLTRSQILNYMVRLVSDFLQTLKNKGLPNADSPAIELENAGWGLEYGVQTAEDFQYLFENVDDEYGKLHISWDINHLLHAVGSRDGKGVFMLTEEEITEEMKILSCQYGHNPAVFANEWIKHNLLHPQTKNKVRAIHLSDCALKEHQYFTNGKLEEPWFGQLENCRTWEEKEEYGVNIVLTHYDSHLPLGKGILEPESVRTIVGELDGEGTGIDVLYELKNSSDLLDDLTGGLLWNI